MSLVKSSLLLAVAAVTVAELGAQRPQVVDTMDAGNTMSVLRARQNFRSASDVLRQVRGPQAASKLDALADSLTAFVLSYQEGDGRHQAALSAISALSRATRSDIPGQPFGAASERLLRIAEAAHVGMRAAALSAIRRVPDRKTAFALLGAVAESGNEVAYVAVGLLGREMGADGLAELRRIYLAGLIREPQAFRDASAIARYHDWPAPRRRGRP